MLKHDKKKDKEIHNNKSFVFSDSVMDKFKIWRSQAGKVTSFELVLAFRRLWDTLFSAYVLYTRPINL